MPLIKDSYAPTTRGTVIVWGMLACLPFGGMAWQIYHYVVPLRRMGFDVWYVDDTSRHEARGRVTDIRGTNP